MKAKGNFLMLLGAALILAAAALTGYNLLESKKAAAASNQVVQQLKEQIAVRMDDEERTVAVRGDEMTDPEDVPDYVRFPDMEMPLLEVDGQYYIGMVEIPGLDLALPVMAEWSYEALKLAPCRYRGSAYSGDLILAAHNYDSHFGRIKDLRPDDTVLFTDIDGHVFAYCVVEREELPGSAVEDMAAGEWDLTLFTCNYSGQSRVTVRCEAMTADDGAQGQ